VCARRPSGSRTAGARRGSPYYARVRLGLLGPRFPVLGSDFAGQVEGAGRAVSRFGVGDAVFGTVAPRFGAHAEYVCLPEHGAVAPMPATVSFAEAAALADVTALCLLRDRAGLRPGQTVLVNGAAGAAGVAAVQLARHFGAVVTGVCSGPHVRLVRKLGAASVIDYTRADFTQSGRRYDVILDVAGTSSYRRCRRVLNRGGVYLTAARSPAVTGQDLLVIRELAEKPELTAVIGGRYPLERIADAHARVGAGDVKGTIVVTMA
jgi:NADPH:quinone reductase-like Zn-dependent oxidoreductase